MNKQSNCQVLWTNHDSLVVLGFNAVMVLPWLLTVILGNAFSAKAINKIAESGNLIPASFWAFSLLPMVLVLGLIFNRKKQVGCSVKALLGLPSKEQIFQTVHIGMLGGFSLFFVGFFLLQFWSSFLVKYGVEAPRQYIVELLRNSNVPAWQMCCVGIIVVILAPIVEEILYRGILYERIKSTNSKFVAILLTSAFFAVIHTNLFALPGVFLVGIGLNLIYETRLVGDRELSCYSGKVGLLGSMVAHLTFNLLNFLMTISVFKM